MKKLIVNADDFGFTRDVNAGIVEAYSEGILTATTIMANGAAFQDAVRLARENPGLDIGCHLVLVQGESVLQPGSPLPRTTGELVRAALMRRVPIYEELRAQVVRVLEAGLRPTHLDTHKHTHVLPPVLDAVARLSEEFRIRWVRRPLLSFGAVLAKHGCRTTDHFAGFRMTGKFGAAELADKIRRLPQGTTEFMCHPGRCGPELRDARTRLKESREAELEALKSPGARRALSEAGVELVNYRNLT
jgi:predicted glycoside hydrolase/deacetylase ChbG (UPF0249 family)